MNFGFLQVFMCANKSCLIITSLVMIMMLWWLMDQRTRSLKKVLSKLKIYDGVIQTVCDMRFVFSLRKYLTMLSKLDSLGYCFYTKNEFIEISIGFLVIKKGRKKKNLYKLIRHSTWGWVVAVFKGKVHINEKFNLKSCNNNDHVKQEKQVKFNEVITTFCYENMMLKGCFRGRANQSKILSCWTWSGGYTIPINEVHNGVCKHGFWLKVLTIK